MPVPELQSRYFPGLSYREDDVVTFPRGLYGFEDQTAFVLVSEPSLTPLVSLQSLSDPGLCFLAAPFEHLVSDRKPSLTSDEQAVFSEGRLPSDGAVLSLAIVTLRGPGSATANLLAPVLIDTEGRRGLQTLQAESGLSHEYPISLPLEPVCS